MHSYGNAKPGIYAGGETGGFWLMGRCVATPPEGLPSKSFPRNLQLEMPLNEVASLESMSSGAIHKTIYMPAARDFHLLLPDRETKDAIAADLDTRLAEAAAILQSALETIKALPAAALREVFG